MTVAVPVASVATVTPPTIVATHIVAKTIVDVAPITFVNPNSHFMEVHTSAIVSTPVIAKTSVPIMDATSAPIMGTTYQTAIPSESEESWHKTNLNYQGCLYVSEKGVISSECGG